MPSVKDRIAKILRENRLQDNSAELRRILADNKRATAPKKAGER